MDDLSIGYKTKTTHGRTVKVLKEIGRGGQGIVYEVECDGKSKALKWYFIKKIRDPRKFYDNLENNIKNGAPTTAFIWPLDTVRDGDGFGYIMELRPSEYVDFKFFILAKEKFTSFTALITRSS
jgi:hypothetical protein